MYLIFLFEFLLPIAFSKGNAFKSAVSFIKEDQQCPTMDNGYINVESNPNNLGDLSGKKIYSCQHTFTQPFQDFQDCNFKLYYCTFDQYSQIPINIITNSAEKDFEIHGCTFNRGLTCSIKVNAPKGNIKKCQFIDGFILSGGAGGYIEYSFSSNDQVSSEGLIISENTFKIDLPTSLFYFTYNPNSQVEFTNNQIQIGSFAEGTVLFDCTPINEESVHWNFSENEISSETENYQIKSPNAEKLQVKEPSGGGGGDEGGGDDDDNPNCPDDPGEYLNSELYTYTCGNTFDFSIAFDAKDTILAIFHTTFTDIGTESQSTDGPIIKVVTNKDLTGIKDPMKLVNCQFSKCYCYTTQIVYIESAETSRTFEIKNCTFKKCRGGIQIKSNGASFDVQNCSFTEIYLNNGCITYESLSASSSKRLLEGEDQEEFQYLMRINNCSFNQVSGNDNGAAICITLKEEPKKPILINDCNFKAVNSGGRDAEDQEKGGSIYFSSYKTLADEGTTTTTDDFALKIADCTFTESSTIYYGGSIYLLVSNKELSKPIEINHCSFNHNKVDNLEETKTGSGGDIYYTYQSSETSTATGDSFRIINCDFTLSEAPDYGGSVYISVEGSSSKTVTLNECTFNDCVSNKGNTIDVVSGQPTAAFKIDHCHFKHKSSINFNAVNGEITNCDFTEMIKPVRYECNSEVEATENSPTLKIENCNFKQVFDINSLIYLVPKSSSNFIFNSNTIDLSEAKTTFIIDSDSITTVVGRWTFESNTLTPKKKSIIKTQKAGLIPAECESFGFKCVNCLPNDKCHIDSDDGYETIEELDISSSQFNQLTTNNDHGGAIYVKNWGLKGKNTKFNSCEALPKDGNSGKAGGGIYIYIDKPIQYQIALEEVEFDKCKAYY